MKRLFIVFVLVMGLAFAGYGLAGACGGYECTDEVNASVVGGVVTPVWSDYGTGHNGSEDSYYSTGQAGMEWDLYARGTKDAHAQINPKFNNYATMSGEGHAFQMELGGAEYSESAASTVSTVYIDGYAKGIDGFWCNTGIDEAKVDLTVFGSSYQSNGAFSDDKESFIGGSNWSRVDFLGQTDKIDHGKFLGVDKWDLSAYAYDRISAEGIAEGITKTFAHNVTNKALVLGSTESWSKAYFNGQEYSVIDVTGGGNIGGVAHLPNVGSSVFNSDYKYTGKNYGKGVANGASWVEKAYGSNFVTVTAFGSAHSSVKIGHNSD